MAKRSSKKTSDAGAPVTTHLCERDERGRMWVGVKMSGLERRFLDCWHHHDGPDLEREVLFDVEAALEAALREKSSATLRQAGADGGALAGAGAGGRRWRADYVHRRTRTLIEVEGGAWSGGRHTRGAGFTEDASKYLRAWELGWTVLRLSEKQISVVDIGRIVAKLRNGGAEKEPVPSWLQSLPP